MKVDILGTKYTIEIVDIKSEPDARENDYTGLCLKNEHKIKIVDLKKHPDWANDSDETKENATKETLRHEIVHAFLNESGLKDCANRWNSSWTSNEEAIDWFAIQGPKIMKAWKEAGCLE